MIAIPISEPNSLRFLLRVLELQPLPRSGTKHLRTSVAVIELCRAFLSIVVVCRFWPRLNARSIDNPIRPQHRTVALKDSKERRRNDLAWSKKRIAWRWIHPGGEITAALIVAMRRLFLRRIEFRTSHHKTNNATACLGAILGSVARFGFRSVGSALKTVGVKHDFTIR